jgi:hypothetical protein
LASVAADFKGRLNIAEKVFRRPLVEVAGDYYFLSDAVLIFARCASRINCGSFFEIGFEKGIDDFAFFD